MNPKIFSLLALVACTALSSAAASGELVAKTFSKKTYPDSRERQYQVYIPDTVTGSDPVPMVMVLHGCRQTERNMIDETGFKELADRENFIVVYPFPKRTETPTVGDSGLISTFMKVPVKPKICIRSRLKSSLNSRLTPSVAMLLVYPPAVRCPLSWP
jgi:hypothetical protein